ncbi:hypothetical protein MMC29_008050 [Sticta canariensis]|nr:hypothetical protein [Sticta canariensis]
MGTIHTDIGLGVYETEGTETTNATLWALQAGYRGFDSAQIYHNEHEVGSTVISFLSSGMNTSGLTREDIFYTTKLFENTSYEAAKISIQQSLQKSKMGYIDLFLLHSPYGGKEKRLESWKAVENAIEEGTVKSGGVSNFGVKHLQELLDSKPRILPVVNQIEVHPFNTRTNITSFCNQHGIIIQAYAPLVRALRMEHPTIASLAHKYSCGPAQLLVRWSLQHGFVPLPKSITKERIISNGSIGGFEIDAVDMKTLDNLDEYLITGLFLKSDRVRVIC